MMDVYASPTLMQPLLPVAGWGTLAKLTCDILAASGRITGQVHAPEILRRGAGLVRERNCYYASLIAWHKTTARGHRAGVEAGVLGGRNPA